MGPGELPIPSYEHDTPEIDNAAFAKLNLVPADPMIEAGRPRLPPTCSRVAFPKRCPNGRRLDRLDLSGDCLLGCGLGPA